MRPKCVKCRVNDAVWYQVGLNTPNKARIKAGFCHSCRCQIDIETLSVGLPPVEWSTNQTNASSAERRDVRS
jgi:hypothetical protein